jgi:hypothetical protein
MDDNDHDTPKDIILNDDDYNDDAIVSSPIAGADTASSLELTNVTSPTNHTKGTDDAVAASSLTPQTSDQ